MTDKYYESEEFKEILREYEDAKETDGAVFLDSEELTDIMEYYKIQEQDDKAMEAYRLAAELYPGAPGPLAFRARYALAIERDREKARDILSQVKETWYLECIYLQAEILLDEQKAEEADEHLRRNMEKTDDEERQDYVLDVIDIYLDYGQYALAKAWLSLVKNKKTAEYREMEGKVAGGLGNHSHCVDVFNQLLDEDPYNISYWNMLTHAQFNVGKPEDAMQSCSFALAINPDDSEALLNAGAACCNLGRYDEAEEHYEHHAALYPKNEASFYFWGIALLDMGEDPTVILEKMQKAYELAPETSPHYADICRQLAFSHSRVGDLDNAFYFLDKSVRLNSVKKEDVEIIRGHFYLENREYDYAQHCFREALLNHGITPTLLYKMAMSFYDCGYLDVALKTFQNLEGADTPLCKKAYPFMANCCRETGKREAYLDYLQKAVEANPTLARDVLGEHFPKDMDPRDYYRHELNNPT